MAAAAAAGVDVLDEDLIGAVLLKCDDPLPLGPPLVRSFALGGTLNVGGSHAPPRGYHAPGPGWGARTFAVARTGAAMGGSRQSRRAATANATADSTRTGDGVGRTAGSRTCVVPYSTVFHCAPLHYAAHVGRTNGANPCANFGPLPWRTTSSLNFNEKKFLLPVGERSVSFTLHRRTPRDPPPRLRDTTPRDAPPGLRDTGRVEDNNPTAHQMV